jgi:predicted acylesterase/phospholipase RssA
MGQLRIGLTISGAISLGAFEGGALAALLAGIQGVNEHERKTNSEPVSVRVDTIAGASAGSITALVAARTALEGIDPVKSMWGSWVELPDMKKLLRHARGAPLSVDAAREAAPHLLALESNSERAQPAAVTVNMALTSLRGLDYEIKRLEGPPIHATTYLDWGERTFTTGMAVEEYTQPEHASEVDSALASGAHAAAFPPYGLDRSGDRDAYAKAGLVNFPESGWIWYTDGGTIDNEPLGRALDISDRIDLGEERVLEGGAHLPGERIGDDDKRLHLLITPDPAPPTVGNDRWSDKKQRPPFRDASLRALTLIRQQHLYGDLRRVEKTNSRIAWTGQVIDTLADVLEKKVDPERALRTTIDDIERQRNQLGEDDTKRHKRPPKKDRSELTRLLDEALGLATGLEKKRKVAVAVVSPWLLIPKDSEQKPPDLLAGEFAHAFGGFLWQPLRENDFAIGYDSMLAWMHDPNGLAKHIDRAVLPVAIAAAQHVREEEHLEARSRRRDHEGRAVPRQAALLPLCVARAQGGRHRRLSAAVAQGRR